MGVIERALLGVVGGVSDEGSDVRFDGIPP